MQRCFVTKGLPAFYSDHTLTILRSTQTFKENRWFQGGGCLGSQQKPGPNDVTWQPGDPRPLASSADDVIPALGLSLWPCCPGLPGSVRRSRPLPPAGGRRPDGGGGPEPKEAGPGRGCWARRQPARLHTIARLRLGPKVRPHGGRLSPLPHTFPSHFTLRLHRVPSAITSSSQSLLPRRSPRSPQSPQRTLPSASAPRPLAVPARLLLPAARSGPPSRPRA